MAAVVYIHTYMLAILTNTRTDTIAPICIYIYIR